MQFTISVTINAPARAIYKAWLSGKELEDDGRQSDRLS